MINLLPSILNDVKLNTEWSVLKVWFKNFSTNNIPRTKFFFYIFYYSNHKRHKHFACICLYYYTVKIRFSSKDRWSTFVRTVYDVRIGDNRNSYTILITRSSDNRYLINNKVYYKQYRLMCLMCVLNTHTHNCNLFI